VFVNLTLPTCRPPYPLKPPPVLPIWQDVLFGLMSQVPGNPKRSTDAVDPSAKVAPTILLIDDDEALAQGLAKLLEKHRFKVRIATDGRQGLEILQSWAVDLVLTDIYMAEMEGLETIMRLRREFPRVQIIAMSGGSRRLGVDGLSLAKSLGASEIMAKPVQIGDLLATIRKLGLEP